MESTLKSGKFDVKLSQEYKDKLESIEKETQTILSLITKDNFKPRI